MRGKTASDKCVGLGHQVAEVRRGKRDVRIKIKDDTQFLIFNYVWFGGSGRWKNRKLIVQFEVFGNRGLEFRKKITHTHTCELLTFDTVAVNDIFPRLSCIQEKNRFLYSTWNSAQCYMAAWIWGKNWIQVHVWLRPFRSSLETISILLIDYTTIENKV